MTPTRTSAQSVSAKVFWTGIFQLKNINEVFSASLSTSAGLREARYRLVASPHFEGSRDQERAIGVLRICL